jgi:hypothetical protein
MTMRRTGPARIFPGIRGKPDPHDLIDDSVNSEALAKLPIHRYH